MARQATQEDGRSRVDPVALVNQELRRQQEAVGVILDDFKTTVVDPISAIVPGLVLVNHEFPFIDALGKPWSVTPERFSEDGSSLTYASMKGEMDVPHSSGGQVTIEPILFLEREGPWPLTDSFSFFGSVSTGIKFVERKMAELLAPAKAAQATRTAETPFGGGQVSGWDKIIVEL